jgi:competence ComEA-like helix-hairpin-helix protein
MMLYTRSQLTVLLLVVLTAGAGLGIGQWRRAHPALAERLEGVDRTSTPADAPDASSALSPPERHEPGSWRPERVRADPAGRRSAPAKRVPASQPIDVNRANEDELRELPGIGSVLAARIVEARERGGPFASLDDLRRVRGLGRSKLERLAASIALGL